MLDYTYICNKTKSSFNIIITCFVVLFCFFIFPVFLVYYSLDFLLETNKDELRENKLLEMNNKIEYLNKYSNNKRYFHFLLLRLSEFAQKTDNPLKYLELNINNLKKNYPDKIQFIVWDNKGKVNTRLSDRIKYKYILDKLYLSLKEVTEKVSRDYSFPISNIESIKRNFNIFRNFFGKIYIPENFKIPLGRSFNAGPFLTELGDGLNHVWFSIKDNISFLCFISNDLLSDFTGLEKISETVNKSDPSLIVGYSLNPNFNIPVTSLPEKYISDIKMALTVFENAGDSIFENNRALIIMSMPDPSVRTFCFYAKTDIRWDYEYRRNYYFCIIIFIILLIYLCFLFRFLYKRNFFSIRWKLTTLFLFANLAPIAVIGFITKDYLDSQKLSIKNEIVSELEKSIRELEARYRSMLDDFNLRLNSIVSDISKIVGNGVIKEEEIWKLKSLYDEFNCSELYIIASNSRLIGYKRDETNAKQTLDTMTVFGKTILSFSNRKVSNSHKNNAKSNIIKLENSEYLDAFIENFGNISDFNIGELTRIYFSYAFGDRDHYNNNYVFLMLWDREYIQNLFLRETHKSLFESMDNADFYIKSNVSNNFYGDKKYERILDSVLENNNGMVNKTSGYIKFNCKNYVFICINGSILKDWSILAVYPEEFIDKRINIILIQIISGIILSLLLTIIIIHILALHFLNPIHKLGEAALAIGNRNFSYRIPIGDKDEFGHLNQVFNRVIEGLADFEVAKIVQESLFPDNIFNSSNFSIYGKSIVATTLGGDYYDCFTINENFFGIIIANVSVKGIPAGLIMAMAKSVVLTSSEETKLDSALLTSRLNRMFFGISGKSLSHIMTFQYMVLNLNDGSCSFTNAGHCPPVLFDCEAKKIDYLDYSEPPLGKISDYDYKKYDFNIVKNHSLILYTYAIIKAFNDSNDIINYNKFNSVLIRSYNSDSEKYYNNIYNAFSQFCSQINNDITLIVVNRN